MPQESNNRLLLTMNLQVHVGDSKWCSTSYWIPPQASPYH